MSPRSQNSTKSVGSRERALILTPLILLLCGSCASVEVVGKEPVRIERCVGLECVVRCRINTRSPACSEYADSYEAVPWVRFAEPVAGATVRVP